MSRYTSSFLVGCTLLLGCGDNKEAPLAPDGSLPTQDAAPDAEELPPDMEEPAVTDRCTTTTGTAATELCVPQDGPARHYRISGVQAPAFHAAAAVVIGFDAPPPSVNGPIAAGQFRVQFYGGGPGGNPAPAVSLQFGTNGEALTYNAPWINTGAAVCFDVHEGSATTAPAFAMWVTGQNSADCSDAATLTVANAYAMRSFWHGAVGAIDQTKKSYYRPAAGSTVTPDVTMLDAAVLTTQQINDALTCTTAFADTNDWQELCAPAGTARHVTINGVEVTGASTSRYFYTVHGEESPPPTAVAASANKVIFTGGYNHLAQSATYFRFNGTATQPQTEYSLDNAKKLYRDGADTVCYDLGTQNAGLGNVNLRVVFWATGVEGADCANRGTLTLANALFDSTTDATAASWAATLDTTKKSYVKRSNTGPVITSVQVSGEPAVLD